MTTPEPSAPAPNTFATAGIGATAKYNPHLWSSDELRAIFVARQNELTQLIKALRNTPTDTVPQHVLLIGQRGMGKSTLLQRIALEVDEDPQLQTQWLALRFPEEQYTVSTLAQFWSNVLGAFIDALVYRFPLEKTKTIPIYGVMLKPRRSTKCV